MSRYWAIVAGAFVVPLTEVKPEEMNRLKQNDIPNYVTAVPVYFAKDSGVWPEPFIECIVVKQVKQDEI